MTSLLERWTKHCQQNELNEKSSPILFICLSIAQIVFLCIFASWLDNTFNSVEEPPYFAYIALICCLCHWLSFIPGYLYHTDNYFDFTGETTFFLAILYSMSRMDAFNIENMAVNGMSLLWVIRLGYFLFTRIKKRGKDFRFNQMKYNFAYYFFAFTAQALWVFLNGLCIFMLNCYSISANIKNKQASSTNGSLFALSIFGWVLFLIGFGIEVMADHQKYKFNEKYKSAKNRKFIRQGLWKYSRHPNYFGEMLLWFGIFVSGVNVLLKHSSDSDGGDHQWSSSSWMTVLIAFISPVWSVFFLISTSLMLLERLGDQRFGRNREYQKYKRQVPMLVFGF